ncbi:MAG TPA: prolipoprotein diacylglyceryl transferase [Candidatus Atribacteria bacterium]|nr:prolipoprotein diacylglyceryl transferase [Candidatus Atribacteria bacterium]
MHPILCQVGPLTIYTYGLFVALGLLLGLSLALKEAKRESLDPQAFLDLTFYTVLAGIIGARIFYVAQNLSFYKENLLSIVRIWEGGLVFQGGLIFAIPVAWIFLKKKKLSFWKTFDVLAPYMALGQAFGRIGCFFAGCCYGKPTNVPWAVTFTDPKTLALACIPLHPTQLYSAAGLFFIFFILLFLRKHTKFSGQLSCLYLIFHSSFRFCIEFFRGDPRGRFWGPFSPAQIICAITFVVAFSLLFYLKRTHPQTRV